MGPCAHPTLLVAPLTVIAATSGAVAIGDLRVAAGHALDGWPLPAD